MQGTQSADGRHATPFRAAEKAFKAYRDGRQAGMPQVLDFDLSGGIGSAVPERVPVSELAPAWLRDAHVYSIRGVDGFRLIRNPFDAATQLRLAGAALQDWIEPPAVTNLVLHHPGPHEDLWAHHQRAPEGSLLSKLTWATVGYHYQWTERAYARERRSPFPPELAQLSADLAAACGWRLSPEAAIINLYGPRSAMGGHRDDAEPCQSVPIVSLSLGLEAVYLLGRETKDHAPIAMRLQSGDVIVQGGDSRGFVHGVPRVLAESLPEAIRLCAFASTAPAPQPLVARWLSGHRLNINVRQCFDNASTAGEQHAPHGCGHGEAAMARPDEAEQVADGGAESRACSNDTGKAKKQRRVA